MGISTERCTRELILPLESCQCDGCERRIGSDTISIESFPSVQDSSGHSFRSTIVGLQWGKYSNLFTRLFDHFHVHFHAFLTTQTARICFVKVHDVDVFWLDLVVSNIGQIQVKSSRNSFLKTSSHGKSSLTWLDLPISAPFGCFTYRSKGVRIDLQSKQGV